MAMTVGRKQYNEGDMLRMQRDAEERVRAMQSKARQTLEDSGGESDVSPQNHNWNSSPNRQRNNRNNQQNGHSRQPMPYPEPEPEPEPIPTPAPEPPPPEPRTETKKGGTIISDIMGALKLDEDYLLIIGLLLILINQRADTTLILALAYLLI